MKILQAIAFIFLAAFFVPQSAHADASANNAIGLEMGGTSLFGLTYDRRITDQFSVGTGITYFSNLDLIFVDLKSFLIIPVRASYGFFGVSHSLRVSAGAMYVSARGGTGSFFRALGADDTTDERESTLIATVSAGYQYWPEDGGFFFRFDPMVLYFGGGEVFYGIGATFGGAF